MRKSIIAALAAASLAIMGAATANDDPEIHIHAGGNRDGESSNARHLFSPYQT